MVLSYPDKKVAIDIADGSSREEPKGAEADWSVLHVSSKDLEGHASFRQVMRRLHRLMAQQSETL
jgi:hypothetical protein